MFVYNKIHARKQKGIVSRGLGMDLVSTIILFNCVGILCYEEGNMRMQGCMQKFCRGDEFGVF